ncbi:quercetin 2,3-dioxygenase [Emticicia aquatilis]|uniref:Quercetin 2,3-dioxygenase n=2 Tax=Emticicia aquatilis TaxID=1537369 RepID=A0A916Z456_9BACT|nr:quercetin 2,3-dioxygenase [Emticicia aquatilis]
MVGDGFRVHNFFPSGYKMGMHRMSPFFLLDYNAKVEFPPKDEPRGVGVHPHRGFETVTIAYHGKIAHHDSSGNSGVIGTGDVQWMTAGSGVLHKEYHDREYSKAGGLFQMVQLWVNLPAKDKMTTPKYQGIENAQLGKYYLPDNQGLVEVIAGEYKGIKGAASTFTPINMYNVRAKKGAIVDLSLDEKHNTGIVVIEGIVKVNDTETAPVDNFILFRNDGTEIKIEALEDAVLLVLSGEPINEPIIQYGPFLMNNKAEILQAYDDLAKGKFGVLED